MVVSSTQFASAERDSFQNIHHTYKLINNMTFMKYMLDAVPNILMVLNDKRQIVFTNQAVLDALGVSNPLDVLGMRPGEAIACQHAHATEGGCGTTAYCRECGALLAVLEALSKQTRIERECRIMQENGDPLDLNVVVSPLQIDGERHVIVILNDISAEKRQQALERTFFHDVMNTAGILSTSLQLIEMDRGALDQTLDLMLDAINRLTDEIRAQKALLAAERGSLIPYNFFIHLPDEIKRIVSGYRGHQVAQGRYIVFDENTPELTMEIDPTLLGRVLGNLIKNGLEASEPGETVTVSYTIRDHHVIFSVHNSAVMPTSAKRQIFQRSFTTKGEGRGLGTYSVKLLTERYMGGKVWFESEAPIGTTFYVSYPLQHPSKTG